ncbi:uncharacterized protein ASCRUDRAFT_74750 [Ascoidea rubescens DSM 1968]|uniref:Spindle pole body component 110 n=1 Tax=Ascoidea rubescens DSM 1968 TaxID=1344418 RepID=A0A1D2VL79_9ASCO|nr:hypothetical protein ASCRUDRAFT_74750 [Ascoidea rubescens DSM 1968]ODV62352.1 hypothetical protein ASCRUDRAFT_74750 [Ascoidea rubescens DSM 1968]
MNSCIPNNNNNQSSGIDDNHYQIEKDQWERELNLTQYEQSFLNSANEANQLYQNYQLDNSFNNQSNNYEITENLVSRLNILANGDNKSRHDHNVTEREIETEKKIDSTTQILINKSLSTTFKSPINSINESNNFEDSFMNSVLYSNDENSIIENKLPFNNSYSNAINKVGINNNINTNLLFKPGILELFFNESSKLNSNLENILVIDCNFSKIQPPRKKFKVLALIVLSIVRMKRISEKNKVKKDILFQILNSKEIELSFEK